AFHREQRAAVDVISGVVPEKYLRPHDLFSVRKKRRNNVTNSHKTQIPPLKPYTKLGTYAYFQYNRPIKKNVALFVFRPYAFAFGVQLQSSMTVFAPVTALFVAAKRGSRVKDVVAVNPDGARLEQRGQLVRLAQVARPDARRQAVGAVIGALGHFLQALKR